MVAVLAAVFSGVLDRSTGASADRVVPTAGALGADYLAGQCLNHAGRGALTARIRAQRRPGAGGGVARRGQCWHCRPGAGRWLLAAVQPLLKAPWAGNAQRAEFAVLAKGFFADLNNGSIQTTGTIGAVAGAIASLALALGTTVPYPVLPPTTANHTPKHRPQHGPKRRACHLPQRRVGESRPQVPRGAVRRRKRIENLEGRLRRALVEAGRRQGDCQGAVVHALGGKELLVNAGSNAWKAQFSSSLRSGK